MKPLLPGQAAFTRMDGKVALAACGHPETLPRGAADFQLRGGMHQVNIANVLVPLVSIVLRLTVGEGEAYFWAWVNELEERVIESLATQTELPIVLFDPLGGSFGRANIPIGVREMAQKYLGTTSRLASESPWTPAHFAAARMFVECQYPTAEKEWAALDRDSKPGH